MTTFDQYVSTLKFPPTPDQAAVIQSDARSMLVVAGAGSGKTATMAQRIVWKVVSGQVKPSEVLGLTFTNKAAGELDERVLGQLRNAKDAGIIGETEVEDQADAAHLAFAQPTISTYNSFAADIAGSYAMLIGEDPRARLLGEGERWQVMHDLVSAWPAGKSNFGDSAMSTIVENALSLAAQITDHGTTTDEVRAVIDEEIAAIELLAPPRMPSASKGGAEEGVDFVVSARGKVVTAKDSFVDLGKSLKSLYLRREILDVVDAYHALKKYEGFIEFADQVSWATRILKQVPEVGEELRGRFKLVLLDEFQDTSPNQLAMLEEAFRGSASVCAVGDPNQAIYSWRGASANSLKDFAQRFLVKASDEHSLSTAFRNGTSILGAANLLMEDVKTPGITVKPLSPPQPPKGQEARRGEVVHVNRRLKDESYEALADAIERELAVEGEKPSIAVLCRKRSYIDQMSKVLAGRDVPHEIIGGESLILRPEVLTLRAALGVVVDPDRNDLLLRLLNHVAIGAADLYALGRWSASFAKDRVEFTKSKIDGDVDLDAREERNLSEALDGLRRGAKGAASVPLTDAGRERVIWLAERLADLRAQRNLGIPDLISRTVEAFELGQLAGSRVQGTAKVTNALAAFIRLGGEFTGTNAKATMAGFLDWIDAVESREHGGESESGPDDALPMEDIEPEKGVVQLLTIHAAKGLEWDVVVIPEVVLGQVDITNPSYVENWLKKSKALPYPVRSDAADLPHFRTVEQLPRDDRPINANDKRRAAIAYGEYRYIKLIEHEDAEARRLAYVAFTRPRNTLIVGSYDFRDEVNAIKGKVDGPSDTEIVEAPALSKFVEEILYTKPAAESDGARADLGNGEVVKHDPGYLVPISAPGENWDEEAAIVAWVDSLEVPEPMTVPDFEALNLPTWPSDVDRGTSRAGGRTVRDVSDAEALEIVKSWADAAVQLVEGEDDAESPLDLVRDHLTASDLVALASDPRGFLVDQRRPIPHRPSRAARTGTFVHAAIARHFDSVSSIDVDALWNPDQLDPDMADGLDTEWEQTLVERFENSPFRDCPPIAVEKPLEITLIGKPVRCVVDAVLDTSAGPGTYPVTIVDWKTGRHPDDDALASRELQLGLYRLAWSRTQGVHIEDIDACFYYLGEPDPARRELHVKPLTLEEIEARIVAALEEGRG